MQLRKYYKTVTNLLENHYESEIREMADVVKSFGAKDFMDFYGKFSSKPQMKGLWTDLKNISRIFEKKLWQEADFFADRVIDAFPNSIGYSIEQGALKERELLDLCALMLLEGASSNTYKWVQLAKIFSSS